MTFTADATAQDQRPQVSVLIAAYNAMDYLPETLASVLQQTFTDFEVVIVNDGSTDHTEEWAAQINDPRVRLVSQANQGLVGARNTGVREARGDLIAFLDADDLWAPTKLEKQVAVMQRDTEAALVYTWIAHINQEGTPTGRVLKNSAEGDVWPQLTEHNIVECGSVALVRRCCLATVGEFDVNLRSNLEDRDMWMRLAALYPFRVVREVLVYYRQLPTSESRNWEEAERNVKIVFEKAFQSAPEHRQSLKGRAYGWAYIRLAWKPLQCREPKYQQAMQFRTEAIAYDPSLRWTWEYFRLSVAIFLTRRTGKGGYRQFLRQFHEVRRRLVAVRDR